MPQAAARCFGRENHYVMEDPRTQVIIDDARHFLPTTYAAACLTCHSTPEVAPATMIKLYGPANGFGWKLNEVVGAQVVSVPMALPLRNAQHAFYTFMGSLLAVFGLTHHTERVRPLTELIPCENCSLPGCRYRRAPYRRPRLPSEVERMTGLLLTEPEPVREPEPEKPAVVLDARYSVNVKALRRWADERLTLTEHEDGTTEALFRYEGSTCSNMGRAFCFHYAVRLGPRAERYPVLRHHCAPAPGDEGHTCMCRYRTSGRRLLQTIARDQPLLGRPIDEVLAWHRAPAGPTCYCESEGRNHKWGLVLETIHYALARNEKRLATNPESTAEVP